MLKRKGFALILLLATTIAYGQHTTWFTVSNGYSGRGTILLHKDTVITVTAGVGEYVWKTYIHVNYHSLYSGQLFKTDTLDITRITGDSTVNNGLSSRTALIDSFGNLQVGFSYGDRSVGETGKWQSGIFNVNPFQKTGHYLGVDTFTTHVLNYIEINGIRYAITVWHMYISPLNGINNFNLVKLKGEDEVSLVRQQINTLTYQTHIEGVYADNQDIGNVFLSTVDMWCFASTPRCYQNDVVKMDTNGNILWTCRPNNNDSFNTSFFQMVQKPDGNILCSWSDHSYAQSGPVVGAKINENTTVWFAEIEYETGQVLWRKNIRQFLEWRMIPQTTDDPRFKNAQDIYFCDVQLTEDGHIVWVGYRYILYPEPNYWKRIPALLKTDLEANPVWYREYDLVPDDTGDKGMQVFNFVQTPDNGFILTGEYLNRFGEFSGGELWQKTALLRLDSKGCLTPGCDATDNVATVKPSVSLCLVYPNPVNSEIKIQYPENMPSYWTVQLTDILGKTVYHSEEALTSIPVQDLSAGVYFLYLQQQNSFHYETHKIIIER
ncbi:MAG: T9SS type A sorting domain-containing protein [Bacteroidia bacterium]|nr:T9SS type A sorting domain-containing protein [Bacteroidia bacterium]